MYTTRHRQKEIPASWYSDNTYILDAVIPIEYSGKEICTIGISELTCMDTDEEYVHLERLKTRKLEELMFYAVKDLFKGTKQQVVRCKLVTREFGTKKVLNQDPYITMMINKQGLTEIYNKFIIKNY